MIVSLTGFMASGKSSVGRSLARQLGCRFIDLDDAILSAYEQFHPEMQHPSISGIFALKGEAFFRQLEYDTLCSILDNSSDNSDTLTKRHCEERSDAAISCTTQRNCHCEEHSDAAISCTTQRNRHCEERNDAAISYADGSDTLVIALGGGAFIQERCRSLLLSKTKCIYLKASLSTIKQRATKINNRPLFKDCDELYAKREPIYSQAHITISCDSYSPSQLAELIAKALH